MLDGKRILLIISGGIAAYKALELIRRLRERGASVPVVLTAGGSNFVTSLSVAALAGETVHGDLFDLTRESEMGHIQLSRDADLIVIAPATADILARMNCGLAHDLATTVLLATDKPVLAAPAMNVRMWQHVATRRNVADLRRDGVSFVGPNDGDMACGEFGPGRMAEPDEIVTAIENHFQATHELPLAGARMLLTAGPTHEPIDPVRYIANRSSGKQGYAIAAAAARAGADVTLVSGPVTLDPPAGVNLVNVQTADEMLEACNRALPADVAIFSAAVADWKTAAQSDNKIKKDGGGPPGLALTENPDILRTISCLEHGRPGLVVGFAAETENVLENATAKRLRKGCDWIVANDVSPHQGVMGGDSNTVHLISDGGVESWPTMTKTDVADRLVARLADALRGVANAAR